MTFLQGLQEEFYNKENRSSHQKDNRQIEEGRSMQHNFQSNISIQLLSETAKGWKVTQFETHNTSARKLRTPKRKIAYYSSAEIKELFTII